MALSDFAGDLGVSFGGVSTASTFVLNLFGILFIGAIVGFITYFIANKKAYKLHIHKFEIINGQVSPSGEDLAREIVLPHTSTRAILLKKHKIYLPRPAIQTGKGHYWYLIRYDGEWVNCRPVQDKQGNIKLQYDHSDMRLANASLKKLVEKNYKKLNWLKEYAPYIGMGILILMLGITFFLIIGEASKVTGGLSSAVDGISRSIELQNEILQSLDNIQTGGGSGIRTG